MAKVTMKDVANAANVSVATVSHVINGTHYVSPELRERVEQIIKTLEYRPNKIARALNTKGIPFVALIVPDISNPYWSTVLKIVQDVMDKHDYSVIVFSSDGKFEREIRFLNSLAGWVSGVIFHPYHVTHEHIHAILGKELPMVVIGDFRTKSDQVECWDHVIANNYESAQEMVEHLIKLGHQRIGFIEGAEGTPSSESRLNGYCKALEKAKITLQKELIVEGDYTREGGRKGLSHLLDLKEPPTAVFCANDFSAFGALEEAKRRRLIVPEDLSIVGFDGIEEAAHASPPLTTIRLTPNVLGKIAAENLIERINGRENPITVYLEGLLVVRDSTAPPREEIIAQPVSQSMS